jgi:hypothetical protein
MALFDQGEIIARLVVHSTWSGGNIAARVAPISREDALRTLERMLVDS